VVAGVGIQPAVAFLESAGIVEGGAIPVDGRLATKAPGVFAAGDIAVVLGHRTGEPQRVEHWVVAERQGQHAARAMLGSKAPYAEVPFFWTKQYDASVKYVGFARGFDRIVYRGNVEEGHFLAGYYQGQVLKAAAGLGMPREILVLGQILGAGAAISPEQLQDSSTDLFAIAQPR
jgi:3-phenylpropionate/trans-cinnamate dioxygenase ferredoxin reductase subunit